MPHRQLQPPQSSGEEFDPPSSGSSSSDESDPENDLLSLSGATHVLAVSSNPTREEYDEVRIPFVVIKGLCSLKILGFKKSTVTVWQARQGSSSTS